MSGALLQHSFGLPETNAAVLAQCKVKNGAPNPQTPKRIIGQRKLTLDVDQSETLSDFEPLRPQSRHSPELVRFKNELLSKIENAPVVIRKEKFPKQKTPSSRDSTPVSQLLRE